MRDLGDETERRRADLAASYQRAIVAALIARLATGASGSEKVPRVALGGGVAANSELREAAEELCRDLGVRALHPARRSCAPTTPR